MPEDDQPIAQQQDSIIPKELFSAFVNKFPEPRCNCKQGNLWCSIGYGNGYNEHVHYELISRNNGTTWQIEFHIEGGANQYNDIVRTIKNRVDKNQREYGYWTYYKTYVFFTRKTCVRQNDVSEDLEKMFELTKDLPKVAGESNAPSANDSPVQMYRMTATELLGKLLIIPDYQRIYCWEERHVATFLNDIIAHDKENKTYLMGTVILHRKLLDGKVSYDIIDGQQRLVTLTLLLNNLGIEQKDLLGIEHLSLLGQTFSSSSAKYIRKANETLTNMLKNKQNLWGYVNTKLLFNVLIISGGTNERALDLAFTFFDSVNSKGVRLTDYNLLKAHHLMYLSLNQESLARKHNDMWEELDQGERHQIVFGEILRRIRCWSRGIDRDPIGEYRDYHEFSNDWELSSKENGHVLNRYMQPSAFRSWHRINDKIVLDMIYPAQDAEDLVPTEITQTIENGDAFFIYAKRYHKLYDMLFEKAEETKSTKVDFVYHLRCAIQNAYLNIGFRGAMLLYFDKFGDENLISIAICIERILSEWRWKNKSVRIQGTMRYIVEKQLIPIISEAVNSEQVLVRLNKIIHEQTDKIPDEPTQTQEVYFNSLQQFYCSCKGALSTEDVKNIECYSNTKQNEVQNG